MLDPKRLIKKINKACQLFFTESSFSLNPSSTNWFKITGDRTSKAQNNYKNDREEVNAIKWFDDIWVYISIRFENKNTLISLTVFQGDEADNIKHQLFRVDWDDYNNNNEKHAQPHWHLTNNQIIDRTFEEFEDLHDSDTFINLLKEEQTKIIDIKKIHFALDGDWMNNGTEVHSLNNEDKIVLWFQGLLSHMRNELQYVK